MARESDKLIIPVSFESRPEEDIQLIAFLFSRSGVLLEKKAVIKESAQFDTYDKNPKELRVFIAPSADKRIEKVNTLAELERYKPYEVVLDFDPEGSARVLPVPDYLSKFWKLRSCRIKGRVIKNFAIGTISQERGVCNARVHICEIDRIWWWIQRIPDHIILRVPELVTRPDWPIPVPDPEPVLADLNPQPLPPVRFPNGSFDAVSEIKSANEGAAIHKSETRAAIASAKDQLSDAGAAIQALPEIRSQLLSGSAASIRAIIADYFHLFHPYFCHIPWLWPYFYRCTEIDVVYTDLNGNFDTSYTYWFDGDRPDIYFWVEYLVDGIWTTVYRPNIPCHTYWNYSCGSNITIRLTDERVRWECNDVVDGDIIWIKTIGSLASVVHIQQTDSISVIQGKSFNRIGLSDVAVWASPNTAGDYRRPFGSTLGFIIQFGSGLPSNGMYYYRWSYRKTRNADLSNVPAGGASSLHAGQVLYKSYTYEYFDAQLHKHIGVNSFKLGPFSKNGNDDLYIIPPVYPSSAPVSASELNPLWDQNTLTVSFDSGKLSDGVYEFILELFDVNGIRLSAIPKHLFQVPDYNTFAPSVDAPDQYLVLNGISKADAFKMNVRIDNNPAQAAIFKIKVNGLEVTSDCCGFVPYPPNANIEVAFQAYHPNNLATFGFGIQKGTCSDSGQTALTNAGGMVLGNAGMYARDAASIYRHSFTPAQLLGTCTEGGKAAFAESLAVSVLATNGSNQLNFLDASAIAAFALEPV